MIARAPDDRSSLPISRNVPVIVGHRPAQGGVRRPGRQLYAPDALAVRRGHPARQGERVAREGVQGHAGNGDLRRDRPVGHVVPVAQRAFQRQAGVRAVGRIDVVHAGAVAEEDTFADVVVAPVVRSAVGDEHAVVVDAYRLAANRAAAGAGERAGESYVPSAVDLRKAAVPELRSVPSFSTWITAVADEVFASASPGRCLPRTCAVRPKGPAGIRAVISMLAGIVAVAVRGRIAGGLVPVIDGDHVIGHRVAAVGGQPALHPHRVPEPDGSPGCRSW